MTDRTQRVWVVSKTPQHRHTPSPSTVFNDESTANEYASIWRSKGWNVNVESFEVRSELSAATKGAQKR